MKISNIGYLLGRSKVVNSDNLKIALKQSIQKEIAVEVHLDLQLNRVWLTDELGKRVYTEVIGVQCANDQLPEVVGGLKL